MASGATDTLGAGDTAADVNSGGLKPAAPAEPTYWLLSGVEPRAEGPGQPREASPAERGDGRPVPVGSLRDSPRRSPGRRSIAFPDAGYYVLRSEDAAGRELLRVLFDAAELGFGSIAAHSHADALAFVLWACGSEVFIDPGTYDYFSFRRWRDHFRRTRAHNTIEIDGRNQSQMQGLFLWGRRAHTRCLRWESDADRDVVRAEHDGYTRLPDPVMHRRQITLDKREGLAVVEDELDAAGKHDVAFHLHLAPECRAKPQPDGTCRIIAPTCRLALRMDDRLNVELIRGDERSMLGWVSRGYHRRTPSTTIVGRCRVKGTVTLRTTVRLIGEDPASADRA